MDNEPRLNRANRQKVKDMVLWEISHHHIDDSQDRCLMWTYRDWPNHKRYALALLHALDTGEPIELDQVRLW